MRVPKVEVDLDEGRMYLESQGANQYHLLHASVYSEGERMRKEELGRYGNPSHPDEDSTSEAGQYRPYGSMAKSQVLWVDSVLEHELVEGVHHFKIHVGPEILGQGSIREELRELPHV